MVDRSVVGHVLYPLVDRSSLGELCNERIPVRTGSRHLYIRLFNYRKDAMQRHLKTKRHEGAVVPAEYLN